MPGASGRSRASTSRPRPGQKIALVGPTGAGKTTLISLIPRFYDPSHGRIEIDGVDIRKATLKSLRQNVGLVQQEPLLFSDTISNNIRYGRLEATHGRDRRRRQGGQRPRLHHGAPRAVRDGDRRARGQAVRAASASGSRSPAPSSRMPRSCSSTSRPPRSTPGPRPSSSTRSTASWRAGRPSWWRTASPPSAMRTRSWS